MSRNRESLDNESLERNTSVAFGLGDLAIAEGVKGEPRFVPGPAPGFEFDDGARADAADAQATGAGVRYPVAHRQSA